jgi:hypothetical protein
LFWCGLCFRFVPYPDTFRCDACAKMKTGDHAILKTRPDGHASMLMCIDRPHLGQ